MARLRIVLVALGLLQMAAAIGAELGEWANLAWLARGGAGLRAIAAASALSPAPKVFTAVDGLETFSSRYFLEWDEPTGPRSVELTPALYHRLDGPYARRNAYGAALAYGPLLASREATRALLESVLRAALGGEAPLLRELGLDATRRTGPVRVRYEFPTGAPDPKLPHMIEARQ